MAFYKDKLDLVYKTMEEENIDMWVIAGDESATNSEPCIECFGDFEFIGMTAIIFNKNHTCAAICTPIDKNGYIHLDAFDEVIDFKVSFIDTFKDYLIKLNPKVVALDYSKNNPASDGLTYGTYLTLKEAFDKSKLGLEIVSAEKIVAVIRGVKSEEELSKITNACIKTQEIFEDAKKIIKAGMNCKDVYSWFQEEVSKRGYDYSWPKSANPGVFSGFDCPGGHMGAPDVVIKKGDLVNIDFGIRVDGYSSDIQRMYYILKDDEKDAPEDIKAAFDVVKTAIKMAAEKLKPGVTGYEVDKVARDYVVSHGFKSWNAALGHQLGHVAHDGGPILANDRPRYNRDDLIRVPLLEGYVFTLEPGVSTRCGNVGIEEDVVVTPNGAKFLIPPQEELYLIKGE